MATSQARIDANRRNAARSTGPKTEEGKERSRCNALKHGLTGAGIVLPEADAAEVTRKAAAYARELNVSDDLGQDLARRAALNAVRMHRAADQQTASLARVVRRVMAEFVPPAGASAEEADRLRSEAARIAMFDPSPEAALARKYEAAAERAFFRCLKELRERAKAAKAQNKVDATLEAQAMMASFLRIQEDDRTFDRKLDALEAKFGLPPMDDTSLSSYLTRPDARIDVPITAGKRR